MDTARCVYKAKHALSVFRSFLNSKLPFELLDGILNLCWRLLMGFIVSKGTLFGLLWILQVLYHIEGFPSMKSVRPFTVREHQNLVQEVFSYTNYINSGRDTLNPCLLVLLLIIPPLLVLLQQYLDVRSRPKSAYIIHPSSCRKFAKYTCLGKDSARR